MPKAFCLSANLVKVLLDSNLFASVPVTYWTVGVWLEMLFISLNLTLIRKQALNFQKLINEGA